MASDAFDFADEISAWIDDVKGTARKVLRVPGGKRCEFQWRLKKPLYCPMLEFIYDHELIAAQRVGIALKLGDEYFAAFIIRADGTWGII